MCFLRQSYKLYCSEDNEGCENRRGKYLERILVEYANFSLENADLALHNRSIPDRGFSSSLRMVPRTTLKRIAVERVGSTYSSSFGCNACFR